MNEAQLKNGGYLTFNRNKAIALFCRECFGFDGHYGGKVGTPFQTAGTEVRSCESIKCPLFYYRNGKDERPTKKKKVLSGVALKNVLRI